MYLPGLHEAVPSVIYTHPAIAWVGKTKDEAKAAGDDYRVRRPGTSEPSSRIASPVARDVTCCTAARTT